MKPEGIFVMVAGYFALGLISASLENKDRHGDTWAMVRKYKWEFIWNTLTWPKLIWKGFHVSLDNR